MSRTRTMHSVFTIVALAFTAACADRDPITAPALTTADVQSAVVEGNPQPCANCNAEILFEKQVMFGRDKAYEIFRVNPAGGNPVRLTFNGFNDQSPAWSPDYTKVAFVSDRDGNREIYIMNADGTNPVRVTFTADQENHPVWSPDGLKLAYTLTNTNNVTRVAYRPIASGSIPAVMADQGCVPTQYTGCANSSLKSFAPSWSANGTEIAYFSLSPTIVPGGGIFGGWSGGDYDLVVTSVAGGSTRNLVSGIEWPGSTHFSPAGAGVLYTDGTTMKIVAANDGTLRKTFSYKGGGFGVGLSRASFSPDGTKIVGSWYDGATASEIFRIDASNGGLPTILATGGSGFAVGAATWSR